MPEPNFFQLPINGGYRLVVVQPYQPSLNWYCWSARKNSLIITTVTIIKYNSADDHHQRRSGKPDSILAERCGVHRLRVISAIRCFVCYFFSQIFFDLQNSLQETRLLFILR